MEDIDLTLFLGGTRSGKSALAEALVSAKARGPVWYLATARPLGDDPAMAERIRATAAAAPPTAHAGMPPAPAGAGAPAGRTGRGCPRAHHLAGLRDPLDEQHPVRAGRPAGCGGL